MAHRRRLRDFDGMKAELAEIVDSIPFEDDPEVDKKFPAVFAAISRFVDRHL